MKGRRLFRLVTDRSRADEDVDAELRLHRELLVDEMISRGIDRPEAERLAAAKLDEHRVKAQCLEADRQHTRSRRLFGWLDTVRQDITFAARSLRRSPGFALVVCLTIGLGVGLTTAVFSVVERVLLRSLPYQDPDRVVRLLGVDGEASTASVLAYPDVMDFRRDARTLESIALADWWGPTLTGDGPATRVTGMSVSANFFATLGVTPALGRFFLADEDVPGKARVVVIDHGFWKNRLGADPSIIGRTLTLNQQPYTVVGVGPERFEDPALMSNVVNLWRPTPSYFNEADSPRNSRSFAAVGRLKPGVTLDQSRRELAALASRLATEFPASNRTRSVRVVSLQDDLVGSVRDALVLLMAMVGAVLVVVFANVANLLLARATRRKDEIAVRLALGASRSRVIRQLVTESLTLGLVGGLLGLVLARFGTALMLDLSGGGIPRAEQVSMSLPVVGFGLVVSLGAACLFGLAPAFQAARVDLMSTLKLGGRTTALGALGVRRALVAAEMALALALVVAAGLLVKSFLRLKAVDAGFDPRGVLTFSVTPSEAAWPIDTFNVPVFYQRLGERLAATPGVIQVGAIDNLPLSGSRSCYGVVIPGRDPLPGEQRCLELRGTIGAYFDAVGMRLLEGRQLAATDVRSSPRVLVVNQSAARRISADGKALGKHLTLEREGWEVVGVVADLRDQSLRDAPSAMGFVPANQLPASTVSRSMSVVVKTTAVAALPDQIRRVVVELDPLAPVGNMQTLEAVLADQVVQPRFQSVLLGIFAGLALLLAAIGLAGVVSYQVEAGRREIAVRMALGASRAAVVRHLIQSNGMPIVVGLLGGLLGAVAASRLAQGLLFGVGRFDLATFVGAAAVLAATAVVATVVPARRAATVEPMAALRSD